MRGCPRCHVRLNAPVQGLMDNILRYTNNTVVYEAFPPQYKPTDSPGSAISTSHILSGVVRARNKYSVVRGLWNAVQFTSGELLPNTRECPGAPMGSGGLRVYTEFFTAGVLRITISTPETVPSGHGARVIRQFLVILPTLTSECLEDQTQGCPWLQRGGNTEGEKGATEWSSQFLFLPFPVR